MEKTDKRADILEAAELLFSEFGFEGTSTRQIAKASGANIAMISYYFGGKEGVFMEIMEGRIAGFKSQLDQINEEKIDPQAKLLKVVECYTDRIFSNTNFHKMMHRELSLSQRPAVFNKIKEALARNRGIIGQIIESGIEKGIFRQVDVRLCIATIFGTISQVVTSPAKISDEPDFDMENPAHREPLKNRVIAHLQKMIVAQISINK